MDNIGFAIPIDKAESSLKDLMNLPTREKVDSDEASYLGIEGETVTADITELYGIPGGVIVSSVVKNGPADKAGVKKGDIITELDGRSVSNMEQLQDTFAVLCCRRDRLRCDPAGFQWQISAADA